MRNLNRMHTAPLNVKRSNRVHQTRALTSLPAGKMVPIAAIPLHREDSVRQGRFRLSFEMMETAEILMNAVNVRVRAYLVPNLCSPRFQGSMDVLNKSFTGTPPLDGEAVIPYVETMTTDDEDGAAACEVFKYLGLHARPDTDVATWYLEHYNLLWNHLAANRSPDIELRDRLAEDLAPAFWVHEGYSHIVPDVDLAAIDGEVALNVTNARLPVTGIGFASGSPTTQSAVLRQADGTVRPVGDLVPGDSMGMAVSGSAPDAFPDIFAELQDDGITLSLSNVELARKTQAFARLREQYEGHSDEWLIEMLMDGLSIPDQALKQPMLLADKSTVFGMSKRYATDSGNLTESVVSGVTFLDLSINLPRIATGGTIMIVAEITPEQLFERQKDPYLHGLTVDAYPSYLRDELDPEKVVIVTNDYVDVDHDTPGDTFGYAPLNHEWNMTKPTIGGRFYRPQVDAGFDEDRQRIWAVETQNPTLSADFYLCTNMHTKVFAVTDQDPFECVTVGQCIINGNTVFGPALVEGTGNYDAIMELAPVERITQED